LLMLRFILWLLFLYIVYKLIKIIAPLVRNLLHPTSGRVMDSSRQRPESPGVDLKNVKDADFEELPNDSAPGRSEPSPKKDENAS
jgi:hypothetical protein